MIDCILVTIMYVHMQYSCNAICYGLPELEAWILVNYLCLFVCLYYFVQDTTQKDFKLLSVLD